jgi:hypothetical protein
VRDGSFAFRSTDLRNFWEVDQLFAAHFILAAGVLFRISVAYISSRTQEVSKHIMVAASGSGIMHR